jgi:repressor LexA
MPRHTIHLYSMPNELTQSQRSVLGFLESRVRSGENPPTYREICKRFGYSSPKAAADHVSALERKGYLVREKGRARGVRLTKTESGIPLLGRIAAGYPSEASSNVEQRLPIDLAAFGIRDPSKAFALRVSGDSMIGRHIFDGDIVLIEQGPVPRKGDIVAALIDNESTLKTLVRKNGSTWLQAENPLYPALIPALDLSIQGVARAVIRFLSV